MTLAEWCANNGDRGVQLLSEFVGGIQSDVADTPETITTGANRNVLWCCSEGHTWETTIPARIRGNNCPYCAGRCATEQSNLLIWCRDNPERGDKLIREWEGKSIDGTVAAIEDYLPFSNKKVYWHCADCGHIWATTISLRTKEGTDCPECATASRSLLLKEWRFGISDTLASWCEANPERGEQLKREWLGLRDDDTAVTMEDVTYGSNEYVKWQCACGNIWVASANTRTISGCNCPVCGERKRTEVQRLPRSERLLSVWCESHGDRGRQLIDEWGVRDAEGNPIGMDEVTYGSATMVLWRCKKGHEWKAKVNGRTSSNANCPYCGGIRLAYEESFAFWCDNNGERGAQLRREFTGITRKGIQHTIKACGSTLYTTAMKWICSNGHEWFASIRNRIANGADCPECKGKGT